MIYYVEVLDGYIDENEEYRGGSFRFEEGLDLFMVKCVDRSSAMHLWKVLQEQYAQNSDWDEVTLEMSPSGNSGYAQYRHRDIRSKIISMYTHGA